MERNYPVFTVSPKAEKALRAGHPWVYAEELRNPPAGIENGSIADVVSEKGRWLGAGFISLNSKIRIRVLSRNTNDRFDEAFWQRRVRYALDCRRTVMGSDFSSCRLIFGEADGFPGLTVDKFENVLVTEVLSYGTDRVKDVIYRAVCDTLADYGCEITALYERNEAALRTKEGLELYKDYYAPLTKVRGDGHVIITENGLKFDVDYINGQKTGYFLDQKYNRAAVAKLARGMRVLDCFTHTGAFALNAAAGGAEHVTAVDISRTALDEAERNAALNGITNTQFVCADVFDYLTALAKEKKSPFDFIILDPPAFTKSGATVKSAARGYKEINLKAMKLLPRGGYLATCSCSHFMTTPLFMQTVAEAAQDAGVQLRQLEARQQAPDHPVLWGVPETDYLKFFIFQVV